ncbi:MAG: DUF1634 domain-containing protein [Ignavibacteriales bacterium]|nr:DUF1634 domain-containing protein [Ignavibacteriales bacterium]
MNEGSDIRTERWISRALRAGVVTSAVLMIVGVAVETASTYPLMDGLVDPLAVVRAALSGYAVSTGIVLLSGGILILMLTPIIRVLAALVTFILENDNTFTLVAAVVLGMFVLELLVSLS